MQVQVSSSLFVFEMGARKCPCMVALLQVTKSGKRNKRDEKRERKMKERREKRGIGGRGEAKNGAKLEGRRK